MKILFRVAIVVLVLLGLAIVVVSLLTVPPLRFPLLYQLGTTFLSTAPAQNVSSQSNWSFCGFEESICTVEGRRRVRYGITGQYAILTVTDSTMCSNAIFGDPAVGVAKTCEFETVLSGTQYPWTRCAAEGEICRLNGAVRVRYGAGDRFTFGNYSTDVACTNTVFGDPAVGVAKTCSYQPLEPGTTPPAPVQAAPSRVALENAKPGSSSWQLVNPATNAEIEGYASATSVNRGEAIDFHVSTRAASFNIDIYRMGYYGAAGARLMQSYVGLTGRVQPQPCRNPDGVIECNWSVSRSLVIPAAGSDAGALSYWPSGIYLAKLTTSGTAPRDSYIIFVVRDDAYPATYVAQLPVTTYQAYNYWGGKSLYTGCNVHDLAWRCSDGAPAAVAVSFGRPYGPSSNPAARFGVGAGEFLTNVQPVAQGYPISSAGFDYNMVRWMESQGLDLKYVTNIDLHQQPGLLAASRAFISTGHDEYYSRAMRDRLVQARDAGINLAFFSANQVYWQVRFTTGHYGRTPDDRIMICYRTGGDPVVEESLRTGRFRDLGLPEATFLGSQYLADPVNGSITITNAAHWLFNNTGADDTTVLPGLLGYEVNAIVAGVSPANITTLAHSPGGGVYSDMTYYIAPSGAQVFGTGSMQWAWGLDDFISNGVRPAFSSPIAKAMTANLFRALSERDLAALITPVDGMGLSADGFNAGVTARSASAAATPGGRWRVLPRGDGTVQIVARASGMCLDAYGAVPTAAVGTWPCNGNNNQRWQLQDAGSGRVRISDRRSLLCLSATTGAAVVLQACDGQAAQLWQSVPL